MKNKEFSEAVANFSLFTLHFSLFYVPLPSKWKVAKSSDGIPCGSLTTVN